LRVSVTSLQRVLINLIDNALRYGGDNGKVNVHLECDEKKATIRILDQGPGIPADQRQAVFQPFHRLEASRNKTTGGAALAWPSCNSSVTHTAGKFSYCLEKPEARRRVCRSRREELRIKRLLNSENLKLTV
jgi:K+-sensing histidine kinase KdpD